jgi:hypothetical protein
VPKPTAARAGRKGAELQGGQAGTAKPKMRSSPDHAATTADAAAAEAATGLLSRGHVQQGTATRGLVLRRDAKSASLSRYGGSIGSSRRRKAQDSPRNRHTIIAKEYHYDPPVSHRAGS